MAEVEVTMTGQGGRMTWVVLGKETITVTFDGQQRVLITRDGIVLVPETKEMAE